MNKEKILDTIQKLISEVVTDLEGVEIVSSDSFKSLGVNSIERMEVTMLLLEEIELDIPRIELVKVDTLGELAEVVEYKLNLIK